MPEEKRPLKVLIYGAGNLGCDIAAVCKAFQISYHLVSRSRCVFSDDFEDESQARMVINTIGGRIGDAHETLWRENIGFNLMLMQNFPKCAVFAFSSNAALESWRTPYASVKKSLEDLANSSTNLFAVRVSNLYGHHKRRECFPYKLKSRHPKPAKLALPTNPIQPTPTAWVALKLIQAEFSCKTHVFDLAPSNFATSSDWGQRILGPEYIITSGPKDSERNNFRVLEGANNPTWEALWNQYKGL